MLVTLEGIDGSGKTTAWEALRGRFDEGVTFTREPTETWYGEAVRRSVEDDGADPVAEAFLYVADHAAHLSRTVRPALRAGDVVVSDRYSDSRYAYQGAALEEHVARPIEYLKGVHQPFTRAPDHTIYLDVDPETGADRSGATDKFETAAFLESVRQNYEFLAEREPGRFHRVDATQPPEDVVARVEGLFEGFLDGD
ncbi:MAG: dTMP kinase [Halobacteriaceae archaeon]